MGYEAIEELFNDMLEVEEGFINVYKEILQAIQNPDIIVVINKILNDEKKHASNAKVILDILKE